MTAVRLMPALALAAGIALTFKLVGVASAPWGAIFDAHAATEPSDVEAHPPEASKDAAPAAQPQQLAANGVSAPDPTSQGEVDVLRSLAARRESLNARERDLAVREQTLAIAEKRLEERIAELKGIEARINAALGQRDAAHQEQIQALIKMYESMKPGDAAKIFEKMEREILVAVSSKMKPTKLGSVLALMDPGKAQDLTVLLANRLNPDQILGAKPAATEPSASPASPGQPAAAQQPPVLQPDVLPQPKAELAPGASPASTLPADTLPTAPTAAAAPVSSGVPAGAAQSPLPPGKS